MTVRGVVRSTRLMLAAAVALLIGGVPASAEPVRAGWTEFVSFPRIGLRLNAKLDTGAKTSALDGRDLVRFVRNGQPWIRFRLPTASGHSAPIERPILRTAKVKRAGTPTQMRPVIALQICVAGISGMAQFTLNDRRGMAYPVLLGRRFLAGRLLVDPAATDLNADACAR